MLKRILTSIYYPFRIKNWNTLPFSLKLNLTLIGKIACHSLKMDSHDFVLMAQGCKLKEHFLFLQNGKKAQIACQIQMKTGAYTCSGIYFFITVAFKPFLTKVHAFYECFRGSC